MNRPDTMIAEPHVPLPAGPYELRLAGLRTRRPGGEPIAFDDLDLVLPPGRRAALLARDRAGASALTAVLLRLLDYEGNVTLGGVELADLSRADVAAVIGLCARDTAIGPGDVAANVGVARPDATDAQIADAARRAGLRPGSAVGDDGLSRQRVALARALLADLPVLIVDDDGTGDEAALARLVDAAEDRTLLLVTHRAAVPGATPILRRVDEVVSLSGR